MQHDMSTDSTSTLSVIPLCQLKHKVTITHGHDRHNTTILSIIHNMSTTCFGQYYVWPSSGWIQLSEKNEFSSPSTYTKTDGYNVSYIVQFFSDNCIQHDDGQKQYWPKHVVNIFYLTINQPDALNFMSLFHACTCFEHTRSSSGGQNCTIQPLLSSH